jgi:hypothetical protein
MHHTGERQIYAGTSIATGACSLLISVAATCSTLCGCSGSNPADGLQTMQETGGNVSRPMLRATLPGSWDENWFASPAVFDLDKDGNPEIIAARHSVLYVWNSDGVLLWSAPVGESASSPNEHGTHRMYCSPAVGDLDADGFGEIAIAYSNKAAVYDHAGNIQTGWPQPFPGSSGELRSLAAADIDNDGVCEILVVKTSDGPVTTVWNIDGTQKHGWPQVTDTSKTDYGGYNQNIGVTDLDNDGIADIVATYDICHIGIFKADGESWHATDQFKGIFSCNVPMFHDPALAIQGWGPDGRDRDEFTDSPPAFADIDGDGLPEILLFSDHERAGEYINRGNSLWVLNPDMTRANSFERPLTTGMPLFTGYQDNIVQVAPAPCITRLGGAAPCIVVPSYDGYMRCYSQNATVLWSVQFDAAGGSFTGASEAVAADLDSDGVPEIAFCTYSIDKGQSQLVLLSASGILLHRVAIDGRGSMAAPTLADVDNDGVMEIIISLKDALGGGLGGVQIWDIASAINSVSDWPTGRGNYLRTGEFQPVDLRIP